MSNEALPLIEILIPPVPSFPPSWGWYGLAVALISEMIMMILFIALAYHRSSQHQNLRKKFHQSPQTVPAQLKRTCVTHFGQKVQSLHGQPWLDFLSAQMPTFSQPFTMEPKLWIVARYQAQDPLHHADIRAQDALRWLDATFNRFGYKK